MIEYLLVDLDLDMPLDERTDPAEILELLREIVREADPGDQLNLLLIEYHSLINAESEISGVAAIEAHLVKRVEGRRRLSS
jgi:hypothetical protein